MLNGLRAERTTAADSSATPSRWTTRAVLQRGLRVAQYALVLVRLDDPRAGCRAATDDPGRFSSAGCRVARYALVLAGLGAPRAGCKAATDDPGGSPARKAAHCASLGGLPRQRDRGAAGGPVVRRVQVVDSRGPAAAAPPATTTVQPNAPSGPALRAVSPLITLELVVLRAQGGGKIEWGHGSDPNGGAA